MAAGIRCGLRPGARNFYGGMPSVVCHELALRLQRHLVPSRRTTSTSTHRPRSSVHCSSPTRSTPGSDHAAPGTHGVASHRAGPRAKSPRCRSARRISAASCTAVSAPRPRRAACGPGYVLAPLSRSAHGHKGKQVRPADDPVQRPVPEPAVAVAQGESKAGVGDRLADLQAASRERPLSERSRALIPSGEHRC